MTVSVLVPFRGGEPHRDRAWGFVRAWYETTFPDWQIVVGTSDAEGFSRTQGILDAYSRAEGDVLVVADADCFTDGLPEAVGNVETMGWAIPHLMLHRLSADSTALVIEGVDWRGLPLSSDNRQDSKPYVGFETGTLLVITRDAFDCAPPDPRFVGWGHEEEAWSLALRRLVGAPWRGTADLVHLWHPPAERQARGRGNDANFNLYTRYRLARHDVKKMHALIEEAKHVDPARHHDDQRAALA